MISQRTYDQEMVLIQAGLTNIEAEHVTDAIHIWKNRFGPYLDEFFEADMITWLARQTLSDERVREIGVPELINEDVGLYLETEMKSYILPFEKALRKIKTVRNTILIQSFIRKRSAVRHIPWIPELGVKYFEGLDNWNKY